MIAPYVLDRALILERLGGDEEIFAVMIDMYLQDVDNYCNNLKNSFLGADTVALQREAHTVKGLLATFADEAGAQAASLLEQQIKRGDSAGLAEPVDAIQARLLEVAAVLKTSVS